MDAMDALTSLQPGAFCRQLLNALDASEGRTRRRKRDQTPDTIGLSIKRSLLERAVREDPSPEGFAEWLLRYPIDCDTPQWAGAVSAMARAVLEEWRLAHSLDGFRAWLEQGAPSDDTSDDRPRERSSS